MRNFSFRKPLLLGFLLALVACTGAPRTRDAGSDAGMSCPAGQSLCGSQCVDVQGDPAHCGGCGRACPAVANGNAQCVAGVCVAVCTPGNEDCDESVTTGCEVTTASDTAHCGACFGRCASGANSAATCGEGRCGLRCNAPFNNCDEYPDNGCESSSDADPENCGGCGTVCPWPAGSEYTCRSSVCSFTCSPGFLDCDRLPETGCEASILGAANCGGCGNRCEGDDRYCAPMEGGTARCVPRCPANTSACGFSCVTPDTDVLHCGACDRRCPGGVNAQPTCSGGVCGLRCRTGYGDCDNDPSNGCESNLQISTANCGACGTLCPSGPSAAGLCVAGRCVLRCSSNRANCDGDISNLCEVELSSDAQHCGMCGRACPVRDNANTSCISGRCSFTCEPGYANCDGDVNNGCERNVQGDNEHCGACGNRCAEGSVCTAGRCVAGACTAGTRDCDGNGANGCEATLATDLNNCGACGNTCMRANAVTACVAGRCLVNTCAAGFGNCDNNNANGCETRLDAVTSCGACGRTCALPNAVASCTAGACAVTSCVSGFANCDGNAANGCERALANDVANCGTCGNRCAAGSTCSSGVCLPLIRLDAGADVAMMPDAGSDAAEAGDVASAGMDGGSMDASVDAAPADGSMGDAAVDSADSAMSGPDIMCGMGFTLCGGTCVSLMDDPTNCGMCGRTCSAGQGCTGGVCTATCMAPQTTCTVGSTMTCVNTATNVAHCGGCNRPCATVPNITALSCASGMCSFMCGTGYANCNGTYADGCEVSLLTSSSNCGRCGATCVAPSGPGQNNCENGVCTLRCPVGQDNCNASTLDGCETSTVSNTANCGRCGNVCPTGQICVTGVCVCPTGTTLCGGVCRNLQTDVSNCGMCNRACGTAPNSSPVCTGGACGITCSMGFGNCNASNTDGCELDLRSNPMRCGSCTNACAVNQVCSNSTCILPVSCLQLFQQRPSTASGLYMLDPDGAGAQAPYQAYCDNTNFGGGWTLVAHANNGAARSWNSATPFITAGANFGIPSAATGENYRGRSWESVNATDLMVVSNEYSFGWRNVLGNRPMLSFMMSNWGSGCSTTFLRSGLDFYSPSVTVAQAATFVLGVRMMVPGSNICFPMMGTAGTGALDTALAFQMVGRLGQRGFGNDPRVSTDMWHLLDAGVLRLMYLSSQACTPGSYPCNGNNVQQNMTNVCWSNNCTPTWVKLFVR